ncbi:MAG: NAD-dependent epimerase/dehydratase family protein [Myxococcota bacterium]|nr:NAD-dependent epimerase/dehydratase family protein [Myxococcota bacterium]MDW8364095.1 NAD-dependent epimerase/dehydratase family protein [Myxococcales bacterium]
MGRSTQGTDLERRGGASLRSNPRPVVALSGGDSELGAAVVQSLERDGAAAAIVTLGIRPCRLAGPRTRHYHVELELPGATARIAEILEAERVDAVLHLAPMQAPTRQPEWAHEAETVGTMHLLGALRLRPPRRLLVASTTLVYGPRPDNPGLLTEGHPLRGLEHSRFLRDKLDIERQTAAFAEQTPSTCTTVLRMASILGPRVIDGWASRWLRASWVPTVLGFDPPLQLVHERDAVRAIRLALEHDVSGPINIVGSGLVRVSTAATLAGRRTVPLPAALAGALLQAVWSVGAADTPPELASILRWGCVADGELARRQLGFTASHGIRQALLELGGELRLRAARLLPPEPR